MKDFQFTDDLFVEFYDHYGDCINYKDSTAAFNFYQQFNANRPITKAQADYVLRILQRHQQYVESLHISQLLVMSPKWKNPFKVLDYSKLIFVEKDENNTIWVCIKHPFILKEKLEKECLASRRIKGTWDEDTKIRRYHFYSINSVLLREFGCNNGYDMSEEFISLTEQVEEIWNNEELYTNTCILDKGKIKLNNPTDSAKEFFNNHETDNVYDNLMLAKSMGFQLIHPTTNTIEKICSHKETNFWTTDTAKFFELCNLVSGKIVLLLSREDEEEWINRFAVNAMLYGFEKDSIKVCFRHSNTDKPEFNNWIKHNGFGGKPATGKFLLFKEKPPKWLLEDDNDVTIVVLTGPFLPSSSISQSWINQHPCVVFLGGIRPSLIMDKEIVEL
jgi:hypothetical protein